MKLTDLQSSILNQLNFGKAGAIPGRLLAQRLGFKNDRVIRYQIRELIAKGWPIASSVNIPFGYYIILNEDEAKEYIRVIHSRLIEDAYRERDFRKAIRKLAGQKQLSLI